MDGTGGLILCGGKSSRMGHDKASLRFGPRTLLEISLERMRSVAGAVTVSLAADAPAPRLPEGVVVTRDGERERGPLQGLLEGFRSLRGRAERVIVMPVDMPFFTPPWMERLVEGLAGHAVCMYEWEGFTNALTAAYSLDLLPKLEGLVAQGRMRPMFIGEGEPTRVIPVERHWREGQGPPPLMDMDTPAEYRRALLLAGYGNAAGAEVTVELPAAAFAATESIQRKHGGAPTIPPPPAPETPPFLLPLQAATAAEALALVLCLYPELRGGQAPETPSGKTAAEKTAAAAQGESGPPAQWFTLRRKDSGEIVPAQAPLAAGERLVLAAPEPPPDG